MPWLLLLRLLRLALTARMIRRAVGHPGRPSALPPELWRRGLRAVDEARLVAQLLATIGYGAGALLVGVASATVLAFGPLWFGLVLAATTLGLVGLAARSALRVRRTLTFRQTPLAVVHSDIPYHV